MCMHVCVLLRAHAHALVCVFTCVMVPSESRKELQIPGTGVTCSCEPSDVGAGNHPGPLLQ